MFIAVSIYGFIWVYTSESISRRKRKMYLTSVLRQDIAFFDSIGAGEIATRIENDTHLIQSGIGDKVANSVMFITTFIVGFILAYSKQARLAGVMTIVIPCIGITGAIMSSFTTKWQQQSLTYIADGGSLAEEVLSTIRTAKAFGSQSVLSYLYDNHLNKVKKNGVKVAIAMGLGLMIFFFVIYSSYGLAFV